MSDLIRRRKTCRLCDSTALSLVLQLEPTPPANAFVSADARGIPQQRFPLDVFFCEACSHVQLLDVVDPALLFSNYVYVSGTSPLFVRHFHDYAASLRARFAPPAGSLVVDIGSNDGTLLRAFSDAGHQVLGIDPARQIAIDATASGIPTWHAFFGAAVAGKILAEMGTASIVTANNVFAHVDDLRGAMDAVCRILHPDGVLAFEVSYLLDVYEGTLFDTIYHEHLDYHSVKPLVGFLARCGLEMIEAERVPSHGGSIRIIAQRAGGRHRPGPSVTAAVEAEEAMGLDHADAFRAFAQRIEERKEDFMSLVHKVTAGGRRISGFGAPAKATTLMYHFGMGPEVLDMIADDSPLKQGLFTPGLHIPVLPVTRLYEARPTHVVILAWNFARAIIEKHRSFIDGGGAFIVPLPKVEVV